MLVKDIVMLACEFTENQDIKDSLENNNLNDEQALVVESLTECFNLVNNEIACEYLPIVKVERIKGKDFKFNFDLLASKVLQVLEVRDSNGRRIKFRVFDDYFVAKAGEVEVFYSTVPKAYGLQENFVSVIPERVYAYAVAREYYFLRTMFDDADIWEERFKNSLQVLLAKKSTVIMSRRRWI